MKALLIVDMQVGLLAAAYDGGAVLARVASLARRAHAAEAPVLFLQHDGTPDVGLEPGSPGWQIHGAVAPQPEDVVVRKRATDGFYRTDLDAELRRRGVGTLVLAGHATDYCVDATARSALNHGYDVELVADAHTTGADAARALAPRQVIAHHNEILSTLAHPDQAVRLVRTEDVAFSPVAGSASSAPGHTADPSAGSEPGHTADPAAGGGRELTEEEFQGLYGPWDPMHPPAVRDLLADAPFRWWVAGGWAIDAASGRIRHHDDIDVAVLSRDLAAVRAWLADFHLWEAHLGTLRPLLPGDGLRAGREQLWARRDSGSAWVLDVLLTPAEGGQWLYKRDHRIRRPLEEAGCTGADGVNYLAPEIVLLYKAKLDRPKDKDDYAAMLPVLDDAGRSWLARALHLTQPDHAWLSALAEPA